MEPPRHWKIAGFPTRDWSQVQFLGFLTSGLERNPLITFKARTTALPAECLKLKSTTGTCFCLSSLPVWYTCGQDDKVGLIVLSPLARWSSTNRRTFVVL